MTVIQKLKIRDRWEGREITTMKVAILLCLVYSHFYLFLHLKKHLMARSFTMTRADKRSHYVVAHEGGRVLWHRNTKTWTRL